MTGHVVYSIGPMTGHVVDSTRQVTGHVVCIFQYLDAVYEKNPQLSQDYHGQQVALYAEFARDKLLVFLRSSNYYPLQAAMDICEQNNFHKEMVFLLGKYPIWSSC